MVARTSSSNGRPAVAGRSERGRARAAVLTGLLAVAALPAAYAVQKLSPHVSLLWAALAAVPAGGLGLVALALARGVRARAALSLGRVPGEGTARIGRALGFLGVYAAVTTGLAMAFYTLLAAFGG